MGAFLCPRAAWALGAQLGDPVAARGEPVAVRIAVLDDPGVVARVVVELAADGRSLSAEACEEGAWWTARFSAADVWPAQVLEVRAVGYGKRGGIVFELGEDAPLGLDILEPAAAAARRAALAVDRPPAADEPQEADRPQEAVLPIEGLESRSGQSPLAGRVGVEGRLHDPARLRARLGAELDLSPRLSTTLGFTVGPSFDPPQPAGAVGLGVEASLRWRTEPPGVGRPSLFAGPRLGLELRLPGVDGLLGLEAGVQIGWTQQLTVELQVFGAGRLDLSGAWTGFVGGLGAAFRLGGAA